MRRVVSIIDSINKWVGRTFPLLIIPLIGIILFEVIMRYCFKMPTIWVHELSVYLFGCTWVIVGGFTLLNKRMVNMDVLYTRFSPRTQAIIDICTFILAFIFVLVLLLKSWELGWESLLWNEMSDTAWRVPYYPVRLLLPLGAFLVLIQLISKLIKDIYIVRGKELK
jgi:TRAP-type mannitol/chloroaromatic compound transport system permease small subunit